MTSLRSGHKVVLVLVYVACTLLLTALASAQELSAVDAWRDKCDVRLEALQSKADNSRMVTAIVAAFGAVAAAIAGFATKHDGWRKPSAVVAVLAAALPMVPRMLPDEARLETELARSGRHQLAGIKAEAQLEDFVFEGTRREYRKYVKARFVECASLGASETVPDFPKVDVASEPETQEHAATRPVLDLDLTERAATMGAPDRATLADEPSSGEQAIRSYPQRQHEQALPKPLPERNRRESAATSSKPLALDGDKGAGAGAEKRSSKQALGANAKEAASAAAVTPEPVRPHETAQPTKESAANARVTGF